MLLTVVIAVSYVYDCTNHAIIVVYPQLIAVEFASF